MPDLQRVTDLFDGPQLAGPAPRGLGRAMAGDGKVPRRANDYYPTPAEATRAVMRAEAAHWASRRGVAPGLWEPCGRGGAITTVAWQEFGVSAVATDIVADPAHGVTTQDLLAVRHAPCGSVLTNFPFALARPMVAHVWGVLRVDYLAALFKVSWLNCGESAALWRAGLAPTRRWDLTWRLDFTDGGNPTMDCAWLIWDRHDRRQAFGLLDRQGPVTVDGLFPAD